MKPEASIISKRRRPNPRPTASAGLDKQKYRNIVTSGTEKYPYLTNSTQLNVDSTRDVFEALRHQEDIQLLYTGGTIFHTFLPEAIDPATCRKLVQKISQTKIPYFSITPTFSVCVGHGYLERTTADLPAVRFGNRGLFPDRRLSAARPDLE